MNSPLVADCFFSYSIFPILKRFKFILEAVLRVQRLPPMNGFIDLRLSDPEAGTLGGRFTTLEGILEQIYEELSEKVFAGDSAGDSDDKKTFEKFLKGLKEVRAAGCMLSLEWG